MLCVPYLDMISWHTNIHYNMHRYIHFHPCTQIHQHSIRLQNYDGDFTKMCVQAAWVQVIWTWLCVLHCQTIYIFFLNEKEKNRKSSLQLGLKLKFCAFTACHNKWHAKEVKLKLLKKCHLISVFLLISQNEIQQFNVVNPRAFMKFLILFLYLFKFEIYF